MLDTGTLADHFLVKTKCFSTAQCLWTKKLVTRLNCYGHEVFQQSTIYVRCSNTTGITQRASSGHYSRPTNSSRSTNVTFEFCGGLFKDDILDNPYFGLISKLLFQDFCTKQLSTLEDENLPPGLSG